MGLKINSLYKSFDDKIIFENLSLTFPDKGAFILYGASGKGKTTLLRMIAGLDKKYQGSITHTSEKKVSYAFQEHRLFPQLSALDNVVFANFDRKDVADVEFCQKILLRLGISLVDQELLPEALSGGMRQRVSLARAFVNPAPTLLLDEPTKELDESNVESVLELIKEESEKRLVIIVSHDKSLENRLSATSLQIM